MGVFDGSNTVLPAQWAFVMGQLGSGAVVATSVQGYVTAATVAFTNVRAAVYVPQASDAQLRIMS
jgi:hypothetical protein